MQNQADISVRQDPAKLWGLIGNELKNKIYANPELAQCIVDMTPEQREEFKQKAFDKFADSPDFQVVIEPEKTVREFVPYAGGGGYINKTVPAKTRRLQNKEIEQIWGAYGEAQKPEAERNAESLKHFKNLGDISENERKGLLAIAEAENSPFVPVLKFDKRYLQTYDSALKTFEDSARDLQKSGGFMGWRNSWLGEINRGLGGTIINPVNALANIQRRSRGGVPFGNPEKLPDEEIDKLAMDDAYGQMMPYLTGTKDFEDLRKNAAVGRKISREV